MNVTLAERVDELVHGHEQLLITTPTRAAIASLAQKIETLEAAVREIALEVDRLSSSPSPLAALLIRRGRSS